MGVRPESSAGGYDTRRPYDDRARGPSGGGRDYGSRDDRGGSYRGPGGSGSNMEPVRPRDGGSYRDRDAYGGGRPDDERPPKRAYDDGRGGYPEDPRKLRRY